MLAGPLNMIYCHVESSVCPLEICFYKVAADKSNLSPCLFSQLTERNGEVDDEQSLKFIPSSYFHLVLLLVSRFFVSLVSAVMENQCNCNLGVTCMLSEMGSVPLRLWKLTAS